MALLTALCNEQFEVRMRGMQSLLMVVVRVAGVVTGASRQVLGAIIKCVQRAIPRGKMRKGMQALLMVVVHAAGVVTGAGRQATGAIINFCTYWGVGLSLAATLAFHAQLGVRGLWFGVMAGSGTQARRNFSASACLTHDGCVPLLYILMMLTA